MSLASTATFTRKIVIAIGALIVGSLLFLIIFNVGQGVYKSLLPEKPPPPLVAFGKLPPINLDEGYKPPENITYRVETITGDLPQLPMELKVFSVEKLETKFGDAPRTNAWATSLGFSVPAIENRADTATYVDPKDNSRTLRLGVTSQMGVIDSNYLSNVNLISTKHRGEETAKSNADKVVKVFGLKGSEFPVDKLEYIKYRIDNGKLVEADELSTVNLIKVNYYKADLDKIMVVYPKYRESRVWVLTSNNSAVAAKVDISLVNEHEFTTYPLKGITKAFEELKAGQASFNMEFEGEVFDVRDVKLGYMDTYSNQEYLQPVYVFIGNEGLAAYVSAVGESYIDEN